MSHSPDKLELYSIVVGTITANEQRRNQMAAIYLTVISLSTALLGVYKDLEPLFVVIPMLVTSLFWLLNMLYFRSLAKAKFSVIKEIEAEWEFRPFDREWQSLKAQPAYRRVSLTIIESLFPALIFLGATGYLLYRILCGI